MAEKILGDNYKNIYNNIRKFAEKNGFEHIEGSAYMSKKPMSNTEIGNFIDDLKDKFPYLNKCVREIHQSDISNTHSLNHFFEYDGTAGEYSKESINQRETTKTFSKEELQNFVNEAGSQKESSNERKINDISKVKRSNERTR